MAAVMRPTCSYTLYFSLDRWTTLHSLENQSPRPGLPISQMKTPWRRGTLPSFQPTVLKVDHFKALFSTAFFLGINSSKTIGIIFIFIHFIGSFSDSFGQAQSGSGSLAGRKTQEPCGLSLLPVPFLWAALNKHGVWSHCADNG